jgi:uncharacterized damage-inducible protein DinB
MNQISRQQLIDGLSSDVREIILRAEKLKRLTKEQLNRKREDGGWSVGQVLDHLNIYSAFYLPVMTKAQQEHSHSTEPVFRSGWLGNYFTKLMKPAKDGSIASRMKSPRNARPAKEDYSHDVLEQFIEDQHTLLELLQFSAGADLRSRVPISLSPLIRLKLGDTLRFVVAHEQRHFGQIERLPATKE